MTFEEAATGVKPKIKKSLARNFEPPKLQTERERKMAQGR